MCEALVKLLYIMSRSAEMSVMTPAGLTVTITLLFALHSAGYQINFPWLRAPHVCSVSQVSQFYQP